MGSIPWDTIISSGSSFLGGLLDNSDELDAEAKVKSAAYGARYAYPGQRELGGKVSGYLWENLNMGLTEPEKRMMRGAGRTSILQGAKSAVADTTKGAASQGLRGGAIANIIKNINQSKIPAFSKLETDIQGKDIELKRKRITDLLTYLSLASGYPDSGDSSGGNQSIASIINSLYGGGGGAGTSIGSGSGNAPATSASGLVSSATANSIGSKGVGLFGIPGIAALLGNNADLTGNVSPATEGGPYGGGMSPYGGGGYGMPGGEGVGGIW